MSKPEARPDQSPDQATEQTEQVSVAQNGAATADHPVQDAMDTKPKDEIGGPAGPEPTRFGDWEKAGRCSDF